MCENSHHRKTSTLTPTPTRRPRSHHSYTLICEEPVKVRDGQVRNTPFYVVMGVTVHGERDILGIWAGDGAEGARFWLQVFSELKNRGVEDVLIAVCDGLKGLPEAISTTL